MTYQPTAQPTGTPDPDRPWHRGQTATIRFPSGYTTEGAVCYPMGKNARHPGPYKQPRFELVEPSGATTQRYVPADWIVAVGPLPADLAVDDPAAAGIETVVPA